MWCGACQQDVPGVVASASDLSICCARCGKPIVSTSRQCRDRAAMPPSHRDESRKTVVRDDEAVPFEDLPEFIDLEDWEFEETIQEAQRLVRSVTAAPELTLVQLKRERTDNSHSQDSVPSQRHTPDEPPLPIPTPGKSNSSVPWSVLAIGLGVFVCGAALIGLALVSQRPELWQLGLPMVLGGQVAVLAIVIWQLDVAWNSHRATFVALHALDQQLRQLREQWSQIEQQAATQQQPFYRHLADGASPEVLLADLKDQLDMLSARLVRDKHAA